LSEGVLIKNVQRYLDERYDHTWGERESEIKNWMGERGEDQVREQSLLRKSG